MGLFFAFFSPKEYTSNASVIPEYELQDRVNEVIESYGLLFGLTGSIRENRTPSYLLELYPYMIRSVHFRQKLMQKKLSFPEQDTTITIYQYFTEVYRPSIFHNMYSYLFGSEETSSDKTQVQADAAPLPPAQRDSSIGMQDSDIPILSFSSDEKKVMNELSSRLSAGYQRGTGIVRVSATMPEPDLAAKLVRLTLQTLHEQASNYKTAKARLYKDFLETQQNRSKKELERARRELIEFNGADSQPLNKRMELQSRYEVNLDQYNTLTQQLNRMELNIQEQLPAFRLLDDITVPSEQIQPKRKLIIFLSILLGLCVALSWIMGSFILTKGKLSSQ